MTDELARHFGMKRPHGVIVTKVYRGSPAAAIGLDRGDVLLAIDNHPIEDKSDYLEKIASYTLNDRFSIEYLRDRKKNKKNLKVTTIPNSVALEFARDWLGLRVRNIDRKIVQRYRLSTQSGVVVVSVHPDGASGRVGIRTGDIVRQVNQAAVRNEKEYLQAITEAGKLSSVVLLVQRGRYGYYVTLEP